MLGLCLCLSAGAFAPRPDIVLTGAKKGKKK